MENTEKIKGINFSFYTSEEIQRLSAVEIKSQIAFDTFRNAWPDGLYDPRMGVSPYDRSAKCVTCGKEQHECPGHLGHINLVFPVYNLFLLKELLKLMRAKCFFCHKFVSTNTKIKEYRLLLTMIGLGQVQQYLEFKELSKINLSQRLNAMKAKQPKKMSKKKEDSDDEEIIEGDRHDNEENGFSFEKMYKSVMEGLKEKKEAIEKGQGNIREEYNTNQTSFTHFLKTITTKEFFKECQGIQKCGHCLRQKPTIKLENNNKFYAIFKGKSEVSEAQKIQLINPLEIKEHLAKMFAVNGSMLGAIYGKFKTNKVIKETIAKGYVLKRFNPDFFFIEVLPVIPSRFRPESQLNGQSFLHAHTLMYTKVLSLNEELKELISQKNGDVPANQKIKVGKGKKKEQTENENKETGIESTKGELVTLMFKKWIEMQEAINFLYNSDLNMKSGDKESGIKQLLEKKEGIFRMKIMGKRVNFSGRSVISPDPNLGTSEVGIPLFMATKLTYPENVNAYNFESLKQAVINGPFTYPGAVAIEENGTKKLLEGSSLEQRLAIANRLLENCENKTVLRHMVTGDYVLFNRQPTLHKPSIMSFQARVLPKELTIRMHYVNCAGFNADFDGDEMNVHLLQNYLARAEAKYLSLADQQYILPTSKAPVRGFIQDFIFAIFFVTSKEMMMEHSEYSQLLFEALSNQLGEGDKIRELRLLSPAIIKPKAMWTGKQLVTNIIRFVADLPKGSRGLNMKSGTRVNASYFCKVGPEEGTVIIRDNELLTGVFDKNQIGASSFGFVHSFFELYGPEKTGFIFAAITRLCVSFLKIYGFSCGISDLINTPSFEDKRRTELNNILRVGVETQCEYFKTQKSDLTAHNFLENLKGKKLGEEKKEVELSSLNYFNLPGDVFSTTSELSRSIEKSLVENINGGEELDRVVKSAIAQQQSKLFAENSATGLLKKFPFNNFSTMILTGAKGSVLNQNLITCNLGQQELEGRRAPLMGSGKTLPCWLPYDPNPRCNGYVVDRFLTGLRPQEFFFHCMAGREGLIDTAVKTSRSGYLQRILVKNLESFAIEYDMTVRDLADKLLIQFYYGEDGLNSMKVNVLENIDFLFENFEGFKSVLESPNYTTDFGETQKDVSKYLEERKKRKHGHESLLERFNPAKSLGAISEKALGELEAFVTKNSSKFMTRNIKEDDFRKLFHIKYFESLMSPGDCVGAVAAQSFGEPSTQMTLNTFHLAGHGGVNVTLGIPRLKELLTTKNTKSPCMFLPLKLEISENNARKLCREMEEVNMLEIVAKIEARTRFMIQENGKVLEGKDRCKVFTIVIEFEDLKIVKHAFGISEEQLEKLLQKRFLPRLMKAFKKILNVERKNDKREIVLNQGEVHKKNSIHINMEEANGNEDQGEKEFFGGDGEEESMNELTKEFENEAQFKDEKFYITMKSPLSSNYGMLIK